ncbi:MAG: hypothetical protein H8E70_06750 [Candidatus Marinimicrobia bacterium]|nr:hypothetical protein [Candidatus Neomarinimicrobiota bacterium]
MITTSRTLKILAALLWNIGGIILLSKGGSLLIEADTLKPEQNWTWLAIVIGLLIGGLKAKYLFSKICKNNLARIDLLIEPKVWQFFRSGFFLFLAIMIVTGATLSSAAHNNYIFLISVTILDISIATALLGSSYVFWK